VDISENSLEDEGAKDLAKSLADLKTLDYLNAYKNRIGDEGAKALATLKFLRTLLLSNNLVGDEGAKALASHKNLTYLALDRNEIGVQGAKALALNRSLEKLIFRHTSFHTKGRSLGIFDSFDLDNDKPWTRSSLSFENKSLSEDNFSNYVLPLFS